MNAFHTFLARFRRDYKKKRREISLSKRQQFILITGLLTAGLLLTQLVPADWRFPMVAILGLFTYTLTAIGLHEDLKGIEWATLLILPTLFTVGVALFYFLLPVRWLTRLPVVTFYSVGIYALLLTENIYNIAANRTIALTRAAHSIGFVLTIATYFLLIQTIFAFRLSLALHVGFISFVSFLIIFQFAWSIEILGNVSRRVWAATTALTLAMTQIAWAFYMWPVHPTLVALFFTTFLYSSLGLVQYYLQEKLYKRTILEFTSVVTIVFFLILLATRWRGAS